MGTSFSCSDSGKGCCRTEGLCDLLGQDVSTESWHFVTAPGPAAVPAGPAQALPCSCPKHVQPEDSHNVVHNGKLAGVQIPESDPTAAHRISLAELVAPQAGWGPARPFQ